MYKQYKKYNENECIMNYIILLSIPTGGLCGGLIYFMWEDFYDIKIRKIRRYPRALNSWKQLLNRGFVAGSLYAYLGTSIVDYLIESL